MAKRYWLFKSDPESFSFQDLAKAPKKTTRWDGIRNFQARNYLRDEVAVGDGVLFHHSQEDPPCIVGTATVVKRAYPDPTQFDPSSEYHDPAATSEEPRWYAVDIQLDREFRTPVTLPELRNAKGLEDMMLLRKGSRLSIQPVTAAEWRIVNRLGGVKH